MAAIYIIQDDIGSPTQATQKRLKSNPQNSPDVKATYYLRIPRDLGHSGGGSDSSVAGSRSPKRRGNMHIVYSSPNGIFRDMAFRKGPSLPSLVRLTVAVIRQRYVDRGASSAQA